MEDKTPKTQSAAADFFDALGDSATFYQKYQLNNRLAIPHIADLIKKSETAPTGFLMDLLAKMPDNSAGSVFVDIAMSSTNPRLQEQALELLNRTELSREFAYHQFMAVIGNTKAIPDVVDRAGSNLQVFADKRAIPHLIDRLVTKVTRSITSSGSNTFNKDGSGGGMTTGGTQKVEFPYNQQSIWKALVGLADGSDYQYDMQKWRIWYANTYAKSNLDLRRDE